ncbi:MAG TPA: carboxypeptidase-like regulatory domain-containing protein, partial [Vicinamibacterales bacterium]
MGRIAKGFVVAAFLLVPATAFAQASLSGLVRDASGAVLPGVTVEAASPVLIEKVRTTATDGTGRYQILDLRPGTYTVTFTLRGFATVVREGIELIGTSVVTIGVEMRVGGVQETITVTGESPIVDVQ